MNMRSLFGLFLMNSLFYLLSFGVVFPEFLFLSLSLFEKKDEMLVSESSKLISGIKA